MYYWDLRDYLRSYLEENGKEGLEDILLAISVLASDFLKNSVIDKPKEAVNASK